LQQNNEHKSSINKKTMQKIDSTIDQSIEIAIDQAILDLDREKAIQPFCFLVQHDGCFTSVVPNETDYHFETSTMVDSFKDFGNQTLSSTTTEGYCIVYNSETSVKDTNTNAITVFLKLKNDHLPLKTRIYYFPYSFYNGKPSIDFESAFASEA